jgi:hypothetical protein
MEKIENIIKEINIKEDQAKNRAIVFTFIPVLIGLFLIFYTSEKVTQAQNKLYSINKAADSLRILRDSFRLEYLEAKGYDYSTKKELLPESIKANSLLTQLLEKGSITSSLIIKYYRKSLDQEKVWISLKELGYKNITEVETYNRVLINDETNTIAFGTDVPLFDVKIIALTLIRAGFKIQHLYLSQRNSSVTNLIQIIRTAPSDGAPDMNPAIPVDKIKIVNNLNELVNF